MSALHVYLDSVEVDRPLGRRERAELNALITQALQARLRGEHGGPGRPGRGTSQLGGIADRVADAVSAALPASNHYSAGASHPPGGTYRSAPGGRR